MTSLWQVGSLFSPKKNATVDREDDKPASPVHDAGVLSELMELEEEAEEQQPEEEEEALDQGSESALDTTEGPCTLTVPLKLSHCICCRCCCGHPGLCPAGRL